MALFKIARGNAANLPTQTVDGHAWFTQDDGKFYIDYNAAEENQDAEIVRQPLNSYKSDFSILDLSIIRELLPNRPDVLDKLDYKGNIPWHDSLPDSLLQSLNDFHTGQIYKITQNCVFRTAYDTNTGSFTTMNLGPGDFVVCIRDRDYEGFPSWSNYGAYWQPISLAGFIRGVDENTVVSPAASSYIPLAGNVNLSGYLTVTPQITPAGQVRNIYISTSEPTSSDGVNGDIWLIYSNS